MVWFIAATTALTTPPRRWAEATATVRIERSATITRDRWTATATPRRSDRIVTDEHGGHFLLRLVEFQ